MNEASYKKYKSGRDLVETLRHKDLPESVRELIDAIESSTNLFDISTTQYYERWKKEFFETEGVSSEAS